MHRIIIIVLFSLFGGILIFVLIKALITKKEILGKPPINRILFYIGKLTLFSTWFFGVFQARKFEFVYLQIPEIISWIGLSVILCGFVIMAISFYQLGNANKLGLPTEDTKLKTSGLYRISRNPMYLSFFLMTIGSMIYAPVWFNILFGLIGIYVHILITKSEERFLEQRFGNEWLEYNKKVRRYL